MKYCSSCKAVFNDDIQSCSCTLFKYSKEFKPMPADPVCRKCGSTESLFYDEPWSSGKYEYGNECECSICKKEVEDRISRDEAMKYLIIDNYQGEEVFCDDRDAVEEHFKYYTEEPWEYESAIKDVLILKLEHVTGKVKAEQFKPPHNTHLVFWDSETYRVEEVIEPEISNDGCDYSLNW